MRRVIVLAAVCFVAGGARGAAAPPRIGLAPLPGVLRAPVYATAPTAEPHRIYVVEQSGLVRIFDHDRLLPAPFLDLRRVVLAKGLAGLLSLAFPRDYERSRRLYVDYVGRDHAIHVVEYRSRGLHVLASSARELLTIPVSTTGDDDHFGGQLAFGRDGLLYVGVGDGRVPEAAQDPTSLLGKLLRLDVRKPDAQPQILAYGLRNPWRFSFDSATGDLYIGDVGADTWEEVDYLPRGTHWPVDLGWPAYGGLVPTGEPAPTAPGPLVRPVLVYRHRGGQCSAVIGGYVYHGHDVHALVGRYVYGDFCNGDISSLRIVGGHARDIRHYTHLGHLLSSYGVDARGELYVCAYTYGTSHLYRIVSTE